MDMESNLKIIIWANRIALLYVIWDNDAPDLITQPNLEVKENLGASHDGTSYVQDRLMVHNIVLRNIADGSDAFTYVKVHIYKYYVRVDVKALRDRCEHASMQ